MLIPAAVDSWGLFPLWRKNRIPQGFDALELNWSNRRNSCSLQFAPSSQLNPVALFLNLSCFLHFYSKRSYIFLLVFLTKPKVRFLETDGFLCGDSHYEHHTAKEGKKMYIFNKGLSAPSGYEGVLKTCWLSGGCHVSRIWLSNWVSATTSHLNVSELRIWSELS